LNWFEQNQKKTIFLVILFLFSVIFLIGEIYLKVFISYNPSYYVGMKQTQKSNVINYPYGKIIFNKYGFPDREFQEKKTKPRIAYIGDSICYGVGVGYGYRISEILQDKMPEFEHMNMALGVGEGIDYEKINKTINNVKKFKIDKVIYLMNLNDVLLEKKSTKENTIRLFFKESLKTYDWVRGKSYLLTYIRFTLVNYGHKLGFKGGGYKAYELFPEQYENIFLETTNRVVKLGNQLKSMGSELIVVVIPYEMQISYDAAKTYGQYGIKWSAGFMDMMPQRLIIEELKKDKVIAIDAFYAFIENGEWESSRRKNKLGEYFVYNKGDKLDWNHPNRDGQKKIADFLFIKLKDRFLLVSDLEVGK